MTLAHGSDRLASARLVLRLASYEQLALGYLAVLRKDDGALIGRCGLMDLVVETEVYRTL